MLLQEFDPNPSAVINPWGNIKPVQDCPRVAVSCFELRTFDRMVERLGGVEIMRLKKANWDAPVYRTEYKGVEIALFEAYVGAAGCMGVLEELFAAGVEKLVLFGTCGVLDRSIGDCGIIIPTVALRDEGASFHYAPPSDEIEVNPKYRKEFIEILDHHQCTYTLGKVWTTDAFYRETAEKMERRKAAGCVCVDMECSAVAALARFRNWCGEETVFAAWGGGDEDDVSQSVEVLLSWALLLSAVQLLLSLFFMTAIAAYHLEGKVRNTHRAIDDVKALFEVCRSMDDERADLLEYVNTFGYNPKYGVSGQRIEKVSYWPQRFNKYMQSPGDTLPALMKKRRK